MNQEFMMLWQDEIVAMDYEYGYQVVLSTRWTSLLKLSRSVWYSLSLQSRIKAVIRVAFSD